MVTMSPTMVIFCDYHPNTNVIMLITKAIYSSQSETPHISPQLAISLLRVSKGTEMKLIKNNLLKIVFLLVVLDVSSEVNCQKRNLLIKKKIVSRNPKSSSTPYSRQFSRVLNYQNLTSKYESISCLAIRIKDGLRLMNDTKG